MCEIMDVLINSMEAILSKSVQISNPNIVYLKYLIILLVYLNKPEQKKIIIGGRS